MHMHIYNHIHIYSIYIYMYCVCRCIYTYIRSYKIYFGQAHINFFTGDDSRRDVQTLKSNFDACGRCWHLPQAEFLCTPADTAAQNQHESQVQTLKNIPSGNLT